MFLQCCSGVVFFTKTLRANGVDILDRHILHVVFRPSHLEVSRAIAGCIDGDHLLISSTEFSSQASYVNDKDRNLFIDILEVMKPDFRVRQVHKTEERERISEIRQSIGILRKTIERFAPEIVIVYSDEHILSRMIMSLANSKNILIEDGMVAYRKIGLSERFRRMFKERTRDLFWKRATGFSPISWKGYGKSPHVDVFVKSYGNNNCESNESNVKVLGYPIFVASSLDLNNSEGEIVDGSDSAFFFIGQGLQGSKKISESDYYSVLSMLNRELAESFDRFIYLPHPMERIVSHKIVETGFTISNSTEIAEGIILKSGCSSIEVCSISSTALVNLSYVGVPAISIAGVLGTDLTSVFREEILCNLQCPRSFSELLEICRKSSAISSRKVINSVMQMGDKLCTDLAAIFESA